MAEAGLPLLGGAVGNGWSAKYYTLIDRLERLLPFVCDLVHNSQETRAETTLSGYPVVVVIERHS